jgi:hypothetical protein
MPTAEWREEKAEAVVLSICRLLASPDTPLSVKDELAGVALWNSLKLFAEALQERLESEDGKWSPGVVDRFREEPARCAELLKLMSEPDFSASAYWREK